MLGSKRIIRPSHSVVDAILRTVDAVCVLVALQISIIVVTPLSPELFWSLGATAAVLLNVIGAFCGMYRNWRGTGMAREVTCSTISWLLAFVTLLALGYTTCLPDQVPRETMASWFIMAGSAIATNRVLIRSIQRLLRSRGLNSRNYAIVGVTQLGFQLAENIDRSPELGLSLHGFYDDRPATRTPRLPEGKGRHIGNLDQLVEAARRREIDLIYITFPMRAEERIRTVLSRLSDSTATVYIVPDFFVFEMLHARWTNIGGLPAVSVFEQPFYGVDGAVKRTLDLLLASMALLLFAVPMSVIALLVRFTSPGPIFFRQRRYGLDGREIYVWKFRTMTVCEDGGLVRQATVDDTRITRIGAILRSTSLDELPQLWNVIGGSMSLVGPRPHANAHNEHYRSMIEGYMLRHKVRPGITGLAQVNGCRGETDTLEKMQRRVDYDHRYIREWSVWLDLRILAQTVLVVLARQNAY